jgi:hypothetical protein
MSRKGLPYRCRDEFRLNAPHTFPANRTVTQVARMARDLATDGQVRKSPWRRTLRRGRAPDRYDRTSDRRRDVHRARIGAERNRALPKNCEQIAQARSAGEVKCVDAIELMNYLRGEFDLIGTA